MRAFGAVDRDAALNQARTAEVELQSCEAPSADGMAPGSAVDGGIFQIDAFLHGQSTGVGVVQRQPGLEATLAMSKTMDCSSPQPGTPWFCVALGDPRSTAPKTWGDVSRRMRS